MAGRFDFGAFFRRVSVDDVAMLTRQLATLVGAGIPLVEAVSALIEQVEKEELQKTLALIRDRLNEGTSLAKALEPHAHIFPPIYTNMVAAGEVSGTLETVLERLADFMEKQAHLRSKVGGALAYPILMLLLGTGLMTVMMIVVVPKVTNIYATLDRALPWYTALLIFVSSALSSNQALGFVTSIASLVFTRKALAPGTKKTAWTAAAIIAGGTLLLFFFAVASKVAYLIGVAVGVVLGLALSRLILYIATPAGQIWKDGILLRLPLFGPVFRMLAVSRFSRTLATLLKSGVPLLKAMEIVRHVLDNAMLSKIVEEATGSIREGESISVPLEAQQAVPADRGPHDCRRRAVRAARDDARERLARLRRPGRDARAGDDEPPRAAHHRVHGRRRRVHRVLHPDASHPDERLRPVTLSGDLAGDNGSEAAACLESVLPVGAEAWRLWRHRPRTGQHRPWHRRRNRRHPVDPGTGRAIGRDPRDARVDHHDVPRGRELPRRSFGRLPEGAQRARRAAATRATSRSTPGGARCG